MANQAFCPQCGATLTEALAGLCPACMLKAGLESQPAASAALIDATQAFDPADGGTATATLSVAPPLAGEPFGDYRLLRQLGKGGMGIVYEAHHLPTGRRVALKVLRHALDSPEARKRFLREGRLAASVNHPHSVYVYGTEEIDGNPAIAMELITGGTLQTRVKEGGPLSITEAVDVVLQMIAGLEAAQAVGVLHRDIKPANCFVDASGQVKVGDFGLSISTTGRGDSHLTTGGTFLGTPAFSSPEQLRGDQLDVRSDIYSIGVTFYYLLTGRTPFEADHMVRLLATVLERAPPSPIQYRPEIPSDLARTVLRCLEKQPARRFRNYQELREALLPFSSAAPLPAGPAVRFVAGFCDDFLATSPEWLFFAIVGWDVIEYLSVHRTPSAFLWWLGVRTSMILYFAVAEGLWGATPFKALFGLRVIRHNRNTPGLARAFLRASIYLLLSQIPVLLQLALVSAEEFRALVARSETSWGHWAAFAVWLSLFVTMRRRNGYAAVHDLLSGTRVVRRKSHQGRKPLTGPSEPVHNVHDAPQVGPYHVLERLPGADGGELVVGYDVRLLRRVWIRILQPQAPAVPARLRELARPGRLRWLNGQRSPGDNWDAYEALSGKPLLSLIDQPNSWEAVRYWLLDLAEELQASLQEGDAPISIGLDRVWITADGRAKFLDFPAPTVELPPAHLPVIELTSAAVARAFLRQVAICALEGRPLTIEQSELTELQTPQPLDARRLVEDLLAVDTDRLPIAEVEESLHKPAKITRRRRLVTVAAVPAAILLFGLIGLGVHLFEVFRWDRSWAAQHPDLPSLRLAIQALDTLDGQSNRAADRALNIYLAAHFPTYLGDSQFWQQPEVESIFPPDSQRLAAQALLRFPNPSPQQVAASTAEAERLIREMRRRDWLLQLGIFAALCMGLFLCWGVLELFAALLLGEGLMLPLADLALVNRQGENASRLRLLWRWFLIWSWFPLPMSLVCFALFESDTFWDSLYTWPVWLSLAGSSILLLLFLLGAVGALISPRRSLQDLLSGTFVVPR